MKRHTVMLPSIPLVVPPLEDVGQNQTIRPGCRRLQASTTKLQLSQGLFTRNTSFRWNISGTGEQASAQPSPTASHCLRASIEADHQKFWEIEEITKAKDLTPEESKYELHFVDTTVYSNNRFIVKLPFKDAASLEASLKLKGDSSISKNV